MNRLWIAMCWTMVGALLGGRPLLAGERVEAVGQSDDQPRLVVQEGHEGNVASLAFSPNGKTLASKGRGDDSVKLWNVATGLEFRTIPVTTAPDIAFFQGDNTLVMTGQNQTAIKLWNVASGRELPSPCKENVDGEVCVAMSRDGKTAASSSLNGGEAIKLWGVASGRELCPPDANRRARVTFSPDGKTVASVSGYRTIKLLNVASGKELTLGTHSSSVSKIVFSPNSKRMASLSSGGGDTTNNLKLWNVATGQELRIPGEHSSHVVEVAFSPDGEKVVSAKHGSTVPPSSDGQNIPRSRYTLKLWEVATGRVLHTFGEYSSPVYSVAFSPHGDTVVTGTWGRETLETPDGKKVVRERYYLKLWDAGKGEELRNFDGFASTPFSVAFSPDGMLVASGGSDKTIRLWEMANGKPRTLSGHRDRVSSVAFSPKDGKILASGSWDHQLKLWNVDSGESSTLGGVSTQVAFSPNGKTVVSGNGQTSDSNLRLWDVASGEQRVLGHHLGTSSVAFSHDGNTVQSVGGNIRLWDVAKSQELPTTPGKCSVCDQIAFALHGKTLADVASEESSRIRKLCSASGQEPSMLGGQHSSGIDLFVFSQDGKTMASVAKGSLCNIELRRVSDGVLFAILAGHSSPIRSLAFSPGGATVVSGSADKTLKLWDVASGHLLASLISFADGRWAVVDPEGRFDVAVADLVDGTSNLSWVMPDDPMTPLPLEIFMRDYYEPRLLPRILNREEFEPVRALKELNRVQPEVRITGIEPDPEQRGYVKVTVEAAGGSRSYTPEGKPIATAVHDLRLFRNGQLVGYAGDKDEDKPLAKAGGKPFQRSFRVRLPDGKEPLQFTAYAFNDDRVKSATAHRTYTPPGVIVGSKPRAYLITIGVNRYDDPAWKDLHYAANDARQIGESLEAGLAGQNKYEAEDIVTIPLISDTEGPRLATKANLKAVLDVLAGREADVRAIPGGEKLRQATPDDFVLISFSGHGYGEGGMFYLVPSDTGERNGKSKAITSEPIAKSISSDELSAWLRDVDAGNMVMIVDACHSAASVGEKFKPGPMGSRGLGQLAFDKGMRILAASQADDVALEIDHLKHGLLSSALIVDGMKRFSADRTPKDGKITLDEWLRYGVDQVPILAKEFKADEMQVAGRGMKKKIKVDGKLIDKPDQQPALFDFSKNRRDVVMAVE